MIWASPLAFLMFVPWTLALISVVVRSRSRPAMKFSSLAFSHKVTPSWRVRLKWLPQLLLFIGSAVAIVALARPQRADTKVKKNVEGIDIMLTLDISDSMAIEDMPPYKDRVDAARKVFSDFVDKRPNDRIGLVVFMGEAFTRVPLTLDHGLLLDSISKTAPSRNIKMGTAIGSALATAVGRLKDSVAKSRVIVFATDGENNSGTIDPETALEIAKGFGMKIYTIGIGRDGESKLPIDTVDAFGRKVRRYEMIHSSVNDQLLTKMASETGGHYYRATDGNAMKRIFGDIDRLEKTKIETNTYTKYAELFMPYLQAAVGFLLAGLILAQTVFRRAP